MNVNDKTNDFLKLVMAHQRQIHAFILSLVPNRNDAQDLFQETILVMWSKFDTYKLNSSFPAWGIKIARYKILQAHWRNSRDSFQLSQGAIESIDKQYQHSADHLDEHMRALRKCLQKLSPRDHKLVQWRYEQETPVKEIAKQLERSVQSVYKRFARIHKLLLDCIQKKLGREQAV